MSLLGRVEGVALASLLAFGCVSSHEQDASVADAAVAVDADAGMPAVPRCWPVSASGDDAHELVLSPAITSASVFFLMDVTASMGEEVAALQTALPETIIPGIFAAIPDVELSVGELADFPIAPYGETGDVVLLMRQTAAADVSAAQAAVAALQLRNGLDRPESLVEALYLSITGEGLGELVAPAACPTGRFGHPCFREGDVPIFVVFTDAPSHEGPGGRHAYAGIVPAPHAYADAIAALEVDGARVVGLYSGDDGEGRDDLVALANATAATRDDGSPLVFDVGSRGQLLSGAVVDAIADLVSDAPLRVSLSVEDVDGDGDDASAWFTTTRLESVAPSEHLLAMAGRVAEVRPNASMSYALSIAPPSTLPDAPQRVRIVLREQAGSEVASAEVELRDAALGCP